ncbi:MAG: hypothetical protein ACO331_05110 [Prochlorothrix sp.]
MVPSPPSGDASPNPAPRSSSSSAAWSELAQALQQTLDRLDAIDRRLDASGSAEAVTLKVVVDSAPERVERWRQWLSLGITVLAAGGVLWALGQPQEVAKWARQANIVSIGPEGFAFGPEIEATETKVQVLTAQREALSQLAQNPELSQPEVTAVLDQSLQNLDQLIVGERQRLQTLDQESQVPGTPANGADTPLNPPDPLNPAIETVWLLVVGCGGGCDRRGGSG